MIVAYINGKITYPVADSGIKITLQNPFIKDGDEKTMEVVFPLNIPENMEVFGPLNRLDTTFLCEDFEDCRLMADNFEVVRGKGTITSITEKDVKIQILAGKSYLKYKASFDNIYIDQLEYCDVLDRYKLLTTARSVMEVSRLSVLVDLNYYGFIGQPGQYVFMPVYDEGNDVWANAPAYFYHRDREGDYADGYTTFIVNPAIQPNLMMILRKVMETLGYSIKRNDFDVSPWNKLYVASARVSLSLPKALPHWSCYKFLDEIRKLFNAIFLFDETKKEVSIMPFEKIRENGTVEIDAIDEFSSSYDEEGVEYLEASNLQYELSDCERTEDVISEELRNMFEVREYESADAMSRSFFSLPLKDRMTSLFHCPVGWFYGVAAEREEGLPVIYLLKECGWFSPLIRRKGANYVSLNIAPVAMLKSECRIYRCIQQEFGIGKANFPNAVDRFEGPIAHVNCQNQTEAEILGTSKEKELEYVTVQDVIENGESGPENDSDESILELFFVDGQKYRYRGELEYVEGMGLKHGMPDPPEVILPVPFTDYRQSLYETQGIPMYSMALAPSVGVTAIGQFHNKGLQIRRSVNGNNEVCIKFPFVGKPDPKKIYMCHGKRYICSHIDMSTNSNGIDLMKTGYFYEIL